LTGDTQGLRCGASHAGDPAARHDFAWVVFAMDLDAKTLTWVNIVIAFVTSGVTYLVWSYQPRIHGLRGWSIGLTLCGFGWLIVLLHASPVPAAMTIIANSLVVAGYSTAWLSIRRFNDDSFNARRVVTAVLFFTALFTVAWLAGAELRDRCIMVSFLTGCLALLAGLEIVKGGRAEPLQGRFPTALAFAVLGSALVIRAGLSLYHPPPVQGAEYDDPTLGVALFITTICLIGITLGLLMMSTGRLRNRYAKLALTDELTELPNRRSFLEQGDRLSRRTQMDDTSACVLMMDLDYFSSVNERFGHAGGDQALLAFANLLRNAIRPGDLVARYGGEEFSAILAGVDVREGGRIAERIRSALAGLAIEVRGQTIKITVSIGVAPLQKGDLRAAIRKADDALYQAKALGRDQVAVAADREPFPQVFQQRAFI
jgi:diguanylate cyclase (GGDEF)-like protein